MDPRLDLNQHDPDTMAAFERLPGPSRISFIWTVAERLHPIDKAFHIGNEWHILEPVITAGWAAVRGPKSKTKIARQVTDNMWTYLGACHDRREALRLYPMGPAVDLVRAIAKPSDPYSATCAARSHRTLLLAAAEIDEVLRLAGSPAAGEATLDATQWLAGQLAAVQSGPLPGTGIDPATGNGLPRWWEELRKIPNPVRALPEA